MSWSSQGTIRSSLQRTAPWLRPLFLLLAAALSAPCVHASGQGAAIPVIETIPLTSSQTPAAFARKSQYAITLPASGAWVDAGLAVTPADALTFRASGTLTLADGRSCGPDGLQRGWKDLLRSYPDQDAGVCTVVGRLGAADVATPFAVGAQLEQIAPASGELFLAANVAEGLGVAGTETVVLTLRPADVSSTRTIASSDGVRGISADLVSRLPRRVTDQHGNPGDVVNLALLGTASRVKAAFAAAGWVAVDATDNDAVLHGLLATLQKQAYTAMPMSRLYLYGRPQEMSYARAEPFRVAVERHHLRLWNSGQLVNGQPLWVGSATHDIGLERDQRDNGVTHRVDVEIDVERGFIEKTLAAAGSLHAAELVLPTDPVQATHTATGGAIHTDGRVMVMQLGGGQAQ